MRGQHYFAATNHRLGEIPGGEACKISSAISRQVEDSNDQGKPEDRSPGVVAEFLAGLTWRR